MSELSAAPLRPAAQLAWLRDAPWLHADRMHAYARVFALVTAVAFVARFSGQHSADYLGFWAAGKLALTNTPATAYAVAAHLAVERAQIPDGGDFPFFYPPVFLILCAPLALLPFYWSMLVFVGTTLLAYLAALRAVLPRATLALFGFSGAAVTVFSGQNGLLTTALFGGALAALPRQPVISGICFGCLCYKPHLGIAVPLALLAARQWRAIAAAAATVALLVAASVAVFGIASWRAFFATLPLVRHTLETGIAANGFWASSYRLVVQAGAGVGTAAAVQGMVGVAACAVLLLACRRRPASITGVLPVVALLSTPYLLAYDLVLLAVPMAWVVAQARKHGFLSWEKTVLGCVYLVPLGIVLTVNHGLSLGLPAMLAMFAIVLRRAFRAPPG